jgi:hypothetical protein
MTCPLLRIHDALMGRIEYFQHKSDATGRYGLTELQKCVAAIHILTYGYPADAMDKYVCIGDSTARESLSRFCLGVIELFGPQYLGAPNQNDLNRILAFNKTCAFPGMMGSIDCMHWRWKNYPVTGRGKHPTLILEAVATHDLWIWHAYFGLPCSLNNINILHRSALFDTFLHTLLPSIWYLP